mmetsp:Transcript_10403/g.23295  ORF Transcript_10403/g.23295 Transcript_10403/m.23295 type:complete len:170 (-) Transcript_10403:17-526(-)
MASASKATTAPVCCVLPEEDGLEALREACDAHTKLVLSRIRDLEQRVLAQHQASVCALDRAEFFEEQAAALHQQLLFKSSFIESVETHLTHEVFASPVSSPSLVPSRGGSRGLPEWHLDGAASAAQQPIALETDLALAELRQEAVEFCDLAVQRGIGVFAILHRPGQAL